MATETTATEKTFMLRAFSDNEYLDGWDSFSISIGRDYATLLLVRMELHRTARAEDDQLYKMVFWDAGGCWHKGDWENDGSVFAHTDDAGEPTSACDCADTHNPDMDQVIIADDRVSWMAYAGDTLISTDSIGRAELEAIAQ